MPSFEKVITDNFYIYWYPFALERVFLKKLPKSLEIISNFFYFKESTYPLTCHNYLICNALVHLLLKRFLKEFPPKIYDFFWWYLVTSFLHIWGSQLNKLGKKFLQKTWPGFEPGPPGWQFTILASGDHPGILTYR